MKIYSVKWSCKRCKYLVLDERNSGTFVRKMAIDPDQIFFVNTHCLTIFIFPLIKILIKRMIQPVAYLQISKSCTCSLSSIALIHLSLFLQWTIIKTTGAKNYYPRKKIFLIQNGLEVPQI